MKTAQELRKAMNVKTPAINAKDAIFAEYMIEIENGINAQAKRRGAKACFEFDTCNEIFFNRVYLVKALKELYANGYEVTYEVTTQYGRDGIDQFGGNTYVKGRTTCFTITW